MRHTFPTTPQFYITTAQKCPYLEGREEQKLFITLHGDTAQTLNNSLAKQGFRRSQNVVYRPSCAKCCACLSVRIRVDNFTASKTQKRILRRNEHLTRLVRSSWGTQEQFDLFKTYLHARHSGGGMADMDIYEFAAMIEQSPVRSRIIEYIAAPAAHDTTDIYTDTTTTDTATDADMGDDDGLLQAACLTDIMDDGVSMLYSFYNPDLPKASLGAYIILDHIRIAREIGLAYVYLGYWVPGSQKMDYKAGFSGLEVYWKGQWHPIENPDAFAKANQFNHTPPLQQQIADINMHFFHAAQFDEGDEGG